MPEAGSFPAFLQVRQKMKRKYSFRTFLWVLLFSMMTIVFIIYMSYYVYTESARISSQVSDSLDQQVLSVQTLSDSQLSSLDTVMQNIAYSNLVKEYYLAYRRQPDTPENGNYNSMQNAKVLTNLLTAIIGPNRPVDQIYLYGLDYGTFGIGLDNSSSDRSVTELDWYHRLISGDRNKLMFLEKDERLARFYTYEEGSWFLTLCSIYQDRFYNPIGVIETKRSAAPLLKQLKSLDHKTCNESLYLYDPNGSVVYASGDNENAQAYYDMLSELALQPGNEAGTDPSHSSPGSSSSASGVTHFNKGSMHFFSRTSEYSGFTTLAAVSNHDLYAPLWNYLRINLLFFTGSLVLTFLICRLLARVISNPLTRMYNQLVSLYKSPDRGIEQETIERVETSLIELDTMNTALIDLQGRVQDSMQREIRLKNQELQSHMLALQSQMNPHFLYNSLATMQSLADEENYDGIIQMCQMISRMLRYISSDQEPLVSIRKEADHTRDYLECMKMRYEEDLEYEIDLPEGMMDIEIPKLCLQMIVENAIKFSTRSVRPPWIVRVEGHMDQDHWEITTLDNGGGFSEEALQGLEEKIRYIDETDLLPSLEIDGMGLMNIDIRFRTFYKGKHIFRIGNREEGGAFITIGGWFDQVSNNGEQSYE